MTQITKILSNPYSLIEIGILLIALCISIGIAKRYQDSLKKILEKSPSLEKLKTSVTATTGAMIFSALSGLSSQAVPEFLGHQAPILDTTAALATAWVVIRFVTGISKNKAVAKFLTVAAWSITSLYIIGYLDETTQFLKSISISIGSAKVTALAVIQWILLTISSLWIAGGVSGILEDQIHASKDLSESSKLLLSKTLKIILIFAAITLSIQISGMDLTALAVFTGALGVGIGFSMQKPLSNGFCGLILLADKSIRPNDVIEIGQTYGMVTRMTARAVHIETLDGKAIIVPNEEFVTQKAINWSAGQHFVRIDGDLSLETENPEQIISLIVSCLKKLPRAIDFPEPSATLLSILPGGYAFRFSFFIKDPENGLVSAKGEALLEINKALQKIAVRPLRDYYVLQKI